MSEGGTAPVPDLSEDLVRRLRAVGRAVAPEEIHDLWIFPPLEDVEASSEFLLFTRDREGDRRCVYSARMRRRPVPRDGSGHPVPGATDSPEAEPAAAGSPRENGGEGPGRTQEITDHGTMPIPGIQRLVRRFRRRLGEDDREPLHVAVEGRRERWAELVGPMPGPIRRAEEIEELGEAVSVPLREAEAA